MNEASGKPKIVTETNSITSGVLIVGEKSPLALPLREILSSSGIKIDDPQDFNYIFQTANFEETGFFLEKAAAAHAKFFLILNEDVDSKLSKKVEEKTLEFIQTQKLEGKIIKLSGFSGEEIEAVKKILKAAFSRTPEKIITISGPGTFWGENKLPKKQQTTRKRFIFWGGTSAFLLFLLTLPITFILANVFLGTVSLKNAKVAILTSQFEKGEKQAVLAQEHFTLAKNGFATLVPLFRFLGKSREAREIENWFKIGQELGGVTKHLIEVSQEGQNLTLLILGQKEGEIKEVLEKAAVDIGLAEEELALIEARTNKPPFLKENFEQASSLRKNLVKIKNFLGVAPWILGLKEKRTYLILFQNNFELRPGGGFIGTLGFLTFNNGKLDLKIEDVYTADGQLRGHVEPPKPVRLYLNQIHWYLRDSNWEPDFPTNARQASWFLEKELGVRPDGVIAVDLALVKKILTLTGPVDLPDYQEKISADNLFLKAQIYSQESFFPGSTQKRDFLSGLATAIFTKLSANSNFPWLSLVKAVEEGALEKHLFVFFDESLPQKLVSEQGWGGEIKNVNCKMRNEKCLEDYLMVVEANLGVNKVNYFVKREIKKEAEAKDNFLFSKTILNYENTSPANVSFGGVYKNYLRVLTAGGSTLEKVTLDGRQLDLSKEIDRETIFDKISTGFLVEIPPGGKKTIELFYKTPIDTSAGEFTYQLLVQKQAGTEKDPLIIESNFGLSYNGDLSVDRIFRVKFGK